MDFRSSYLGLKLRNPIVPSASPMTATLEGIRRLEDAGVGAVVVRSLFEEQIDAESRQLDHDLWYGTLSYAEALTYLPDLERYQIGPQEHLDLIRRAKAAVDIPVIASLNGATPGGWTAYARLMEDAGADAIELNLYFLPTDPRVPGADVEEMYLEVLRGVKEKVRVPVSVKIGPSFSSVANMAKRLTDAGADGLVLFNRFYQPDFDIETLDVVPNLTLSDFRALRLPLRWVAILYGRIKADLAITSGVHSHIDVIKATMAGASAVQMASELLLRGEERVREILAALTEWMQHHDYESLSQMRGSMSQLSVPNPSAYERANYMKVLQSFRPDPTGRMT